MLLRCLFDCDAEFCISDLAGILRQPRDVGLYYSVNLVRGLRIAEAALIPCMLGLSFVSAGTVNLQTLTFPKTWPLDLLALAVIVTGLVHGTFWRAILGVAIGVVSLGLRDWGAITDSQKLYCLVHAAIIGGLLFAILTNDRLAERLLSCLPR